MKSNYGKKIKVNVYIESLSIMPADVHLELGDKDAMLTPEKARKLARKLNEAAKLVEALNNGR